MNVSLGKKLEDYVVRQVESGPFNNASEVVRDALRLHEEHYLEIEKWRRELAESPGTRDGDGEKSSRSGRA